jgi:hypothetical protein
LVSNLFKRYGLPDVIGSDRGPQFAARGFREMLRLIGIKSNLSTAYHPQSQGAIERTHQELEAYLSIYCIINQDQWFYKLPTAEFTYNSRRHADRTHAPFELQMGYLPKAMPTTFDKTDYPKIEDRLKAMEEDRREAIAAHELARTRMAERISGPDHRPFRKGHKVWLETKNIKLSYTKKMTTKREGPFEITEVLGPNTFRLKLPEHWKIHDVFHSNLLTSYVETEAHGPNYEIPPPDLIDEEEHYEVSKIVQHKKKRNRYEYLVMVRQKRM